MNPSISSSKTGDSEDGSLLNSLISLFLDYIAWTQIVPAVLAWLFALFVLTALVLVGMDARGENPADAMLAFSERFPTLSSYISAWFETSVAPELEGAADPETGSIDLSQLDFGGLAGWVWMVLSFAGFLLSLLVRLIRGPRPPWPLRFKMLIAGGASVALTLACVAVMSMDTPGLEGSPLDWLAMFSGVGLLVFIVTAWAIVWSHGLSALARGLASAPAPVALRN